MPCFFLVTMLPVAATHAPRIARTNENEGNMSLTADQRDFLRPADDPNSASDGFIVTGTQPKKVILRAIGTSLPFPDRLANPTLELRNSAGAVLDSNDDWVNSPNKQAIIDSTIPPSDPLESAIVRTLTPGNYTAMLRGLNNTTGIAVVEVYALN
jgi:hypothetical protein